MESSQHSSNSSTPDPMIGRHFGSYRIVRKIAQGGMGAVYEAMHNELPRRVAIKVLLPELLNNADAASRFFNEAQAVSLVSHPSLVTLFDHGKSPQGEAYIVMEYLDGASLRQRLEQRYLGGSAIGLMIQLAAGLSATHEKRIVHRDLKPENIMLIPDAALPGGERAKILDFGIAKLLPTGAAEADKRSFKTRTGAVIGTPTYMSPEQCRASPAEPPDEKTDVYALGVIFYELLYGEPPFSSESMGELFALQLFAPPVALKQRVPGLHPAVADLIHRLLAKKPAGRPSMAQLLSELKALPGSGLQDGAAESRPCLLRAATSSGGEPATSGMIRQQLNQANRTTGLSSRGEQVKPPPAARSKLPLVLSSGFVVVCACALLATVYTRRASTPQAPALVATQAPLVRDAGCDAAATSLAGVHAPETKPPPPADGNHATAPAPAADDGSGEGKPTHEPAHRGAGAGAHKGSPRGGKREKFQVDVWK